jgi:hypothetical protein
MTVNISLFFEKNKTKKNKMLNREEIATLLRQGQWYFSRKHRNGGAPVCDHCDKQMIVFQYWGYDECDLCLHCYQNVTGIAQKIARFKKIPF